MGKAKATTKKQKPQSYYGDVEVVVRMRYRVSATLPFDDGDRPSAETILKSLLEHSYDDVTDTEEIEIVTVEDVGENTADE